MYLFFSQIISFFLSPSLESVNVEGQSTKEATEIQNIQIGEFVVCFVCVFVWITMFLCSRIL